MGFHEVLFPTGISWSSQGGPGVSVNIIEVDSGAEERISRWAGFRHNYDASYGVKSFSDLVAVRDFYMARTGPTYGFRWSDPLDLFSPSGSGQLINLGGVAAAATDQSIGTGDGATTVFQLVKRYTNGGITRVRNIAKPVAGTVLVAVNGTPTVSGWSVDTTTGLVTFTTAPTAGQAITAGFQFDVPVRFAGALEQALAISADGFDNGSVASIPLVEIIDDLSNPEEYCYGGSNVQTIAADTSVSIQQRAHSITASAVALSVKLPDATSLPGGGAYFFFTNPGANTWTLRSFSGTSLKTLATNGTAIVCLVVNADNSRTWYVI